METVDQTISLNASKQEAWVLLADFGNAHKYFNGITDSHLVGDIQTGVGTVRHCDLPSMMGMKQYIDEEITEWKEGEEFTYIVTKTAAPIKNGIAVWKVSGNEKTSKIKVVITYQPKGIMGFLMQAMLRKEFNRQIAEGLEDIRKMFEAKKASA